MTVLLRFGSSYACAYNDQNDYAYLASICSEDDTIVVAQIIGVISVISDLEQTFF